MILVPCLRCMLAIRILPGAQPGSEERDVDYLVGKSSPIWPDKFVCPRCENKVTGLLEDEVEAAILATLEVRDLSPPEAFAAFSGLGLPDEQLCTIEAVQDALREKPIRRVIGKNIVGAPRMIVDAIELWDGTRVYFAAGGEGAVIYRIAPPPSATQRALKAGTT